MRIIFNILLPAILFLAVPLPGEGAGYDGTKALICAVTSVQECRPGEACRGAEPEVLNLPRLIVVDTAGKVLSAPQEGRFSAIRSQGSLGGLFSLQGVEEANERRGAFGWSMTIDAETRDFVFAASGQRQSVVVFGSCMEQ